MRHVNFLFIDPFNFKSWFVAIDLVSQRDRMSDAKKEPSCFLLLSRGGAPACSITCHILFLVCFSTASVIKLPHRCLLIFHSWRPLRLSFLSPAHQHYIEYIVPGRKISDSTRKARIVRERRDRHSNSSSQGSLGCVWVFDMQPRAQLALRIYSLASLWVGIQFKALRHIISPSR